MVPQPKTPNGGNGHNERALETTGRAPHVWSRADASRPLGRVASRAPEKMEKMSTGEALAAVARDTIDVTTELVRDAVALGRLELQRSVSELAPRVMWGVVTFFCAAIGGVLAIIAATMALGAVVPSVPARLAILAGVLFVVAFFGVVRVTRPGRRESVAESATATEPRPQSLPGEPARSMLPPLND